LTENASRQANDSGNKGRGKSPIGQANFPNAMNATKTTAEKQMDDFAQAIKSLQIKYPAITLCGDINGDLMIMSFDSTQQKIITKKLP
jgi:hypothetical protein